MAHSDPSTNNTWKGLKGKPFIVISTLPTYITGADFGPDSPNISGSGFSTTGGQAEANTYLASLGGGIAVLLNNQPLAIVPSAGNNFIPDSQFASTGTGTPAISVVGPDNYNSPSVIGVSLNYARQDHDHGLPPSIAGSGATSVVGPDNYGTASVVGISSQYARQDHNHGLPFVPSIPQLSGVVVTGPTNGQILQFNGTNWINAVAPAGTPATIVTGPDAFGASSVVGTAIKYARQDHDHGLPPNPAPIVASSVVGPDAFGAGSVVGVSTAYARQDHDHGLPTPATQFPTIYTNVNTVSASNTYGIQEAIATLSGLGGGTLYIQAGAYSINDGTHPYITISSADNVTIIRDPNAVFTLANVPHFALNSQTSAAQRAPIFVYSGCTNLKVSGGQLTQAGPAQTSGNWLDGCGDWIADNNHNLEFSNAVYSNFGRWGWFTTNFYVDSASVTHNGGSDSIREHDNEFTNCGNLTVPDGGCIRLGNTGTDVSSAVPASTVAATNNNGYTVTVNILTAGTCTAYTVTDTYSNSFTYTTALSVGNLIQLHSGWSIAITYSGAPTWAWYPTLHHVWVGERDFGTGINCFGIDVGNTTSMPITDVWIGNAYIRGSAVNSPQMVGINIEKVNVQDNILRVHINQPHISNTYYGMQFGDGVGFCDVVGGLSEYCWKEGIRFNAINGNILHDITVTGYTVRDCWQAQANGGGYSAEILSGASAGSTINRITLTGCRAVDDQILQTMTYGIQVNSSAASCTISNITTVNSDVATVKTTPIFVNNPTGTITNLLLDLGTKAVDNRSGLSSADSSATTIFTTQNYSGQLWRITADIWATAFTSGTATYTVTYTENSVAKTLVVTATALNTLGTGTDLINPDGGSIIKVQLTGSFSATVNVATVAEQIR